MALNDLDSPVLEELAQDPAGAAVDPTADVFEPEGAATNLSTSPTRSEAVADSAINASAEAAGVASAEVAPTPTIEANPSLVPAGDAEALPSTDLNSVALTPLPLCVQIWLKIISVELNSVQQQQMEILNVLEFCCNTVLISKQKIITMTNLYILNRFLVIRTVLSFFVNLRQIFNHEEN